MNKERKMKKIIFNRRNICSGYNNNVKGETELISTSGYCFEHEGHQFVVHKAYDLSKKYKGWQVSEFTTGLGATKCCPTRIKAIENLPSALSCLSRNDLDAAIAGHIEKYGRAN